MQWPGCLHQDYYRPVCTSILPPLATHTEGGSKLGGVGVGWAGFLGGSRNTSNCCRQEAATFSVPPKTGLQLRTKLPAGGGEAEIAWDKEQSNLLAALPAMGPGVAAERAGRGGGGILPLLSS